MFVNHTVRVTDLSNPRKVFLEFFLWLIQELL